jgi:4-hydroxybenzoate polyprenyltransferase
MIFYSLFIVTMVVVGYWARMGACYFSALLLAGLLIAVEYALMRTRQREGCFKAFVFNNWIGAVIFAGIAADFLFFLPLFPGPPIGR